MTNDNKHLQLWLFTIISHIIGKIANLITWELVCVLLPPINIISSSPKRTVFIEDIIINLLQQT